MHTDEEHACRPEGAVGAGSETPCEGPRRVLTDGMRAVEAFHRSGASGEQVCEALTALWDQVVGMLYEAALAQESARSQVEIASKLALIAVGGYGRAEPSARSDLDVLFLLDSSAGATVRSFVSRLLRHLWDSGFAPAHSVRTTGECLALARSDMTVRTAMLDARPLRGSRPLFGALQRGIRRGFPRHDVNPFLDALLAERRGEYSDYYAPTAYLLEPNIKKSPGGLRDLHLLRWVGSLRYGTTRPDRLGETRVITPAEAEHLRTTREYLLHVRHELHFHAGSAQDVLTREEQVRLAGHLQFQTRAGLLDVEQFMREYYRRTTRLHEIVMRMVEGARWLPRVRRFWDRLMAVRLEDGLVVDRTHLRSVAPEELSTDVTGLLKVFETARLYGVGVEHRTFLAICTISAQVHVDALARRKFLEVLSNPAGLAELVRRLHEAGLLSAMLPEYERARGLIQFNLSHTYTVDEHTLRALKAAVDRQDDPGPIGRAYREIRRKDILHLAILLHDLGKGLEEDHCEVGRRMAAETGAAFGLDEHERELLAFLVHQHLLMAHSAFRRDVSDEMTVVQFARVVATPEALRHLYVLTAADTAAVSPENLTAWKESLLTELYIRAAEELSGQEPVADEAARGAAVRDELRRTMQDRYPTDWLGAQLDAMPLAYLLAVEQATLTAHLDALQLGRPVEIRSRFVPATGVTELNVVARDDLTPGIFHKIAAVLASERFQILDARIVTCTNGMVLDTFRGIDADSRGEPTSARRAELGEKIARVLIGSMSLERLLLRTAGSSPSAAGAGNTKIEVDNDSSDRFTILEVFADDRPGLLYDVTRTLFECGLSVHSARISTHIDQVVDAFYVTADGAKLTDAVHLNELRRRLVAAVERL